MLLSRVFTGLLVGVGAAMMGCDEGKKSAATPSESSSSAGSASSASASSDSAAAPAPAAAAQKPAFAESPVTKTTLGKPKFVMTVDELFAEHRKDRDAAAEKYGGQIIDVSGVVSDMGQTVDDKPYVVLRGKDRETELQCITAKPKPWGVVGLGQKITLRGHGNTNSIQSPVVDAEFQTLGPSRTYRYSTTELASILSASSSDPFILVDPPISLVLTGGLKSASAGPGDATTLEFEAVNGISCVAKVEYSPDMKVAAGLKPGTKVSVYSPMFSRSGSKLELKACRLVEP